MGKIQYLEPTLEIITLSGPDVVCTSGDNTVGDDPWLIDPDNSEGRDPWL